MAAASAMVSVSASTAASNLPSYTTYIDWGSKGWTFLSDVHKSSWELFSLCFEFSYQLVPIVCLSGLILARLSSGTLAILLGFKLGSSLDLTVISVQMLTWGSRRSLSYPPDLGITGSCSEYSFIGSSWSGRSDVGLLSFRWRSDSLIVDNVETWYKLYCIMC